MLTLTDYHHVNAPKINGLLGADLFHVSVSAAGTNRSVQLDGGGQPFGVKGDRLIVSYAEKGANWSWNQTTPKSGKIAIDYATLFFSIAYQDMEDTDLLPI
jgi:hypothetical protein